MRRMSRRFAARRHASAASLGGSVRRAKATPSARSRAAVEKAASNAARAAPAAGSSGGGGGGCWFRRPPGCCRWRTCWRALATVVELTKRQRSTAAQPPRCQSGSGAGGPRSGALGSRMSRPRSTIPKCIARSVSSTWVRSSGAEAPSPRSDHTAEGRPSARRRAASWTAAMICCQRIITALRTWVCERERRGRCLECRKQHKPSCAGSERYERRGSDGEAAGAALLWDPDASRSAPYSVRRGTLLVRAQWAHWGPTAPLRPPAGPSSRSCHLLLMHAS